MLRSTTLFPADSMGSGGWFFPPLLVLFMAFLVQCRKRRSLRIRGRVRGGRRRLLLVGCLDLRAELVDLRRRARRLQLLALLDRLELPPLLGEDLRQGGRRRPLVRARVPSGRVAGAEETLSLELHRQDQDPEDDD